MDKKNLVTWSAVTSEQHLKILQASFLPRPITRSACLRKVLTVNGLINGMAGRSIGCGINASRTLRIKARSGSGSPLHGQKLLGSAALRTIASAMRFLNGLIRAGKDYRIQ